MSAPKKSIARRFRGFLRRILGRPLRVLGRTGQVLQILHDVAQVQREQRRQYRRLGEIALKLTKDGVISNLSMQRLVVKIEENDRIMRRQEKQLYLYQRRGTFKDALKNIPEKNTAPTPDQGQTV